MEQKRNKDGSEEPGVSPPVPTQSLELGSEKTFPHPSGESIQTEGGAYIGGPVTNIGGLNVFGGRIGEVHLDYHGARHHISRRTLLVSGFVAIAIVGGGLAVWEIAPWNTPPWITRYTGHTTAVWTVDLSPDGKLVASAEAGSDLNRETTMHIWEAQTGNDELVQRYKNIPLQKVVWSPDGTSIAIASRDGAAYIWNTHTRDTKVYGKPVDNDYVMCIAWSPDGTRIVTGHFDKTVKIWDIQDSLQPVFIYKDHSDAVRSVAWSPGGAYIASGSQGQDLAIRIWNAQTGKLHSIYPGHADSIQSIAWSWDGHLLASSSSDRTVHVWSPTPPIGQRIYIYRGHSSLVTSVAWSPENQRIVSAGFDSQAHVWNAKDGSHLYVYTGHTNIIRSVSWARKTNYIATASDDTTVQIWRDQGS